MITSFALYENMQSEPEAEKPFAGVHPLDEEGALELLRTRCTGFSLDNTPLYRGVSQRRGTFALAVPSEKERRSKPAGNGYGNGNQYTLLVDNLPSWSGWPKRSKSLCMATNDTRTGPYTENGKGMVYRCIPMDGAVIAVCATKDFWFSFKYLEKISDGTAIVDVSRRMKQDFAISDVNWDAFCRSMDRVGDAHTSVPRDVVQMRKYLPMSYIFTYGLIKRDWRERLDGVLDPVRNKFWKTPYAQGFKVPGYNKEVWTDGDCLMIEDKTFKRLVKQGKIK